MLVKMNCSSGEGGSSNKLYGFSWNQDNYVCVITESSSADILAIVNYNDSGIVYEDDYIKATMTAVNKLKVEVKKDCVYTTFTQFNRTDTPKNAGDITINEVFNIGCGFINFTN